MTVAEGVYAEGGDKCKERLWPQTYLGCEISQLTNRPTYISYNMSPSKVKKEQPRS